MPILAFDTCLGAVSAAVRWQSPRGEWLLREAYEERPAGHAERLMPLIEEVMKAAGLGFDALARIAVTHGPGTFTGVRTGIAAARALALAIDRPVVATSSLAVIAHRADQVLGTQRQGRPIAVGVAAGRTGLFFQLFGENVGEPLTQPEHLAVAEAAALIGDRDVALVGSGARSLTEALRSSGRSLTLAPLVLEPHARALALLAPVLSPVSPVQPLYLRAPDAKPHSQAMVKVS